MTTGRVRGKRRTGPLRYLPGGWSDETAAGARVRRRASRRRLPLRHGPDGTGRTRRLPPALASVLLAGALRARAEGRGRVAARSRRPCAGSSSRTCTRTTSAACLRSRTPRYSSHASNGNARRGCEDASAATSPSTGPRGLEPRLVDPPHDVAGDGSLIMVSLPGHTPGHAGLVVEGETLLAGDARDVGGFEGRVLRAHD